MRNLNRFNSCSANEWLSKYPHNFARILNDVNCVYLKWYLSEELNASALLKGPLSMHFNPRIQRIHVHLILMHNYTQFTANHAFYAFEPHRQTDRRCHYVCEMMRCYFYVAIYFDFDCKLNTCVHLPQTNKRATETHRRILWDSARRCVVDYSATSF